MTAEASASEETAMALELLSRRGWAVVVDEIVAAEAAETAGRKLDRKGT